MGSGPRLEIGLWQAIQPKRGVSSHLLGSLREHSQGSKHGRMAALSLKPPTLVSIPHGGILDC